MGKVIDIRIGNLDNKRVTLWQKPCHTLEWCPYGPMVENFPLAPDTQSIIAKAGCSVFGHICPVYFIAENFAEEVEDTTH